jgi:hypothetical protein
MTNRKKEIAKFLCGFEAFHVLLHAYLWASGTTLTVFGIVATPTLNIVSAVVNAVIALTLGIYAWRPFGERRSD